MKIHRSSSLEILEDRIAPAGLVDVNYNEATGELTLTGDAVSNSVSLSQTGTNTYRIEGIGTDIETAANLFQDIGELTKLTFVGGAGDDTLRLFNLHTLTSLSFFGDAGVDDLDVANITVKGPVDLHAGIEGGEFFFDGLLTSIGGNLTVDSATGAADNVSLILNAQKTAISGGLFFTGGGAGDSLEADGGGPLTIGKGVSITAGSGGTSAVFSSSELTSIGKLPTGESILFTGGVAGDNLEFSGLGLNLAGGIRMSGGGGGSVIGIAQDTSTVKIGKLPTGESILLTGDAADDFITIDAGNLNLAGGIDLAGAEGSNSITLDSEGGIAKIGKLAGGQSLRLTGGTASDSIFLTSSNLSLAGGVELLGAAGNNTLQIQGGGGKTTLGKLATGESIHFTGGADADTISIESSLLTLAGGIDFAAGDGTNLFDLVSENGTAKFGKLSDGQSILFTGGAGSDTLATLSANLTLAGAIEFSPGNGTNRIDIDGLSGKATIGKLANGASIFFTGGTGGDTIDATVATLTLAGGIEFGADAGSNLINLASPNGAVKLGKLTSGQSIFFQGGAGTDNLSTEIAVATLAGGIEFRGEGGNNDLDFDDGGLVKIGKFGTGQSILYTGTGNADNEMDLGGFVTLAGSVEVTGGTGTDDIDFDGKVIVGTNAAGVSVILTGSDGDDDIDFTGNISLAGSLKLDGGNDDDTLDLDAVDILTVKGAVEMIGGAGLDDFDLVVQRLSLGSTVTFTGGADSDLFSVIADGSIAGDVIVDLGTNAASNEQTIFESLTALPGGLVLKGALTVDTDAASTTVDSLRIINVSIAKLIDIELGGGISTVNIDNLIAGDEFKLDTRAGADVVNIERGDFFGNSIIKKLATILTGDGDDQLAIGSPLPAVVLPFPDHTRVNFIGGLVADGGLGANDNRNDFGAENTFGVPLTVPVGFELTTIV